MFTLKRFAALAACGLLALALLVAACTNKAEAPTDEGDPGVAATGDADGESPSGETPDDGGVFTLMAADFEDGGAIPARLTCDGDETSPALMWSGAPEGTRAFAIIVEDPDAPGDTPFIHFVVYDLPGGETELEEGIPVPSHPAAGGYQGRNDAGRTGWAGPCPPEGETHSYDFYLYALIDELGLEPGATADEVLEAAAGKVLGVVKIAGTYGR